VFVGVSAGWIQMGRTTTSKLNMGLNAMTSVFESTNKSIRPEAEVKESMRTKHTVFQNRFNSRDAFRRVATKG